MPKTPDDIKKGLAMCTHGADCGHCPYTLYECSKNQMEKDALALIQQLEEDKEELIEKVAQLEEDIKNIREGNPVGAVALVGRELLARFQAQTKQLEAERDAAVKDMHEAQGCLCLICKNYKPDPEKKKYICKAFGDYPFEDGPLICRQFGWRGVQKEE